MRNFMTACVAVAATLAAVTVAAAAPPPPAIGIGRGGQVRGRTNIAPPPPAVGIGHGGEIRGRTNPNPPPPAIGIGRGGQIRGSTIGAAPPPPVVRGTDPPVVRIPAPPVICVRVPPTVTRSGMVIESLSSTWAFPGNTLVIHGRHFGTNPGEKIVAINGGGLSRSMEVLEWSDRHIRVRVPAGLSAGGTRVLIYYDESLRASSNSAPLTLILDRLPPR